MWRNSQPLDLCSDSDSLSNDSLSNDSGSLSHVPISVDIPIDKLSLKMDQVPAQIEQLTAAIQSLLVAQQQQAEQLVTMDNRIQACSNLSNSSVPQVTELSVSIEAFYKIPDPIKAVPIFDGNKKQLHAWLNTAENALAIFDGKVQPAVFRMYEDAINNKIQGRAKDALCLEGNPTGFSEIKEILINTCSDRDDLSTLSSQLWQNKMGASSSLKSYYLQTKEQIQKIKLIARQNKMYKDSWPAINGFIDETSLAAFVAGLQDPYFGYVQAARPLDLDQAYAFLCKFRSNESTAQNIRKGIEKKHQY